MHHPMITIISRRMLIVLSKTRIMIIIIVTSFGGNQILEKLVIELCTRIAPNAVSTFPMTIGTKLNILNILIQIPINVNKVPYIIYK
jgi:hypothetical protein